MIDEKIRKIVYWTLDLLKGRKENNSWSRKQEKTKE